MNASELTARAQAVLAGGDGGGYRALLAAASRVADPHQRYHGRLTLLREGSAVPAGPRSAAILGIAAAAAIEDLEATPSEPLMLHCAASIFAALGAATAARALAEAAHRLDPALGGAGSIPTEASSVVSDGLDALSRRAVHVAGLARPAVGLTLSLCMIVRDEEQMLPRCLAVAAPVVDELIIVDTGSRDATVDIARSFGARVIHHEWTDSFAQARNVSFDAATGDWLMYLDADQVLCAEDAGRLHALTGHTWREAFTLLETSHLGAGGDGYASTDRTLRVLRNRPHYRFTGRVHEQISHALPASVPGRVHHSDVRVDHYGYLESVRGARGKAQRNIALLHRQAEEGEDDAFLHFNLGAEHAADGDVAAALDAFERAWSMIVAQGSGVDYRYTPQLIARLVEARRQTGRHADAATLAADGLRRYPDFTDLVFAQARIAFETGALGAAREGYRRCVAMGDAPARYQPITGSGTYLPRVALAQLALGDGDLTTARDLLAWCLDHHPDFHGALAPYLTLVLRSGVTGEVAVADVEARLGTVSPAARLSLGAVLADAGARAAAARQYRLVLQHRADCTAARVALARLLLREGDLAGAAEAVSPASTDDLAFSAAASLPGGDPDAVRIRLTALICAGDVGGAAAVLAGAVACLGPVEAEVFGVWLGLAAGVPGSPPLPAVAVRPLSALLESLLRAHLFAAFEQLMPALVAADLPTVGRHHLLAEMYLRNGFAASAAQEWMAVCAQAPDVPALLGLAGIALSNGQPQDAAVFADGALELDPGNAVAADLLARVAHRSESDDAAITGGYASIHPA